MLRKLFGHKPEKTIQLAAPVSGKIVLLEQVPDPVFSQKLAGDGIAIDPGGNQLVAPVDAVVSRLFHTNHAIGLTTKDGIEILLHIGIETVKLNGRGFQPSVSEGEKVRAGDVLITFDADAIRGEVPSLVTPLLITNTDRVAAISAAADEAQVTAGKDTVLTLTLR